MTKVDPQAKIQKLKAAQAKLNAELQAAEEQAAAEERKRETRRKMLIGEALREAATNDPKLKTLMDGLLDAALNKDRDRELFDLPARSARSASE